ncbi:hypothetical protein V8B97DRAFT_1917713 [Scleroderma yunnanense]
MVLVVIATPPGGLSLFNFSSQSTIQLLWDFDDKVFHTAHCPELLAENDHINAMDQATLAKWGAVVGLKVENAKSTIDIELGGDPRRARLLSLEEMKRTGSMPREIFRLGLCSLSTLNYALLLGMPTVTGQLEMPPACLFDLSIAGTLYFPVLDLGLHSM